MACFFIAGATGYSGSAFVKCLLNKGHEVIAHIRPTSKALAEKGPLFQSLGAKIDTSTWNEKEIHTSLQSHQPTHVGSMLGTTAARAKAAAKNGGVATYEAVERDLSIMLLNAASEMKKPPRFIFLSAMGADKTTSNRYMRARTEVEKAIFESGLSYCIARPAFVSGPDREEFRFMERTGTIVSDAILDLSGLLGAKKFRDSYRSLTAEKLAQGMVDLALKTENIIANPYRIRHPNH